MGPSMCSQKNKSLVRRRESLLSLRLVAMISRCSSVSSSVHATPGIFRSFLFIQQMSPMEKIFASFRRSRIVKKYHFPVNAIQSLQVKSLSKPCNTLKQKQDSFFSEWTRSLIHRSASMNQRGVSDEHANRCKRKSSSCMRRLSKYKQKLFMH